MNRSILNAACAFAALFLLATAADAACPDSPKVTRAQPKDKERLLKACLDDGAKMHPEARQGREGGIGKGDAAGPRIDRLLDNNTMQLFA
jgi:hypothetical protein